MNQRDVPGVVDWDDAPEFMRNNIFIRRGYRVGYNTYATQTKTLFMCHNETVNVWSHLGTAIFLVGLVGYVLVNYKPTSLHDASLVTRWTQDFDQGRFD